jgi:hypothetical protein
MTEGTDPRRERIARNEAAFRELNDALEARVHDADRAEQAGFVCECGNADCDALVHVPLERYAAVRRDPRQFLLLPGHEIPGTEDVVDRGDGYVVVRKHPDVDHVVADDDASTGPRP